jgi:hypothetical protein
MCKIGMIRCSTIPVVLAAMLAFCGCKKGCGGTPGGSTDAAAEVSAEGKEVEKSGPEKAYVGEIERLGKDKVDYLVVGIDAPSFAELALEQKLLAYWLNMAAIAGNDIMYLQNHRYALAIKSLLETVYLGSESGGREIEGIRENLLEYLKYVWTNHGQYDHRSSIKFVPNRLTKEQLVKITAHAMQNGKRLDFLQGGTAEEKLEPLLPHIFDADDGH